MWLVSFLELVHFQQRLIGGLYTLQKKERYVKNLEFAEARTKK